MSLGWTYLLVQRALPAALISVGLLDPPLDFVAKALLIKG